MKKLVYVTGMVMLLLPFALHQPKAVAMDVDGGGTLWYRSDSECGGKYDGCERTQCLTDGAEQCEAQYCNANYCG